MISAIKSAHSSSKPFASAGLIAKAGSVILLFCNSQTPQDFSIIFCYRIGSQGNYVIIHTTCSNDLREFPLSLKISMTSKEKPGF